MNYIDGTLDENRTLEFSESVIYMGEKNNSAIRIDISDWQQRNATFYTIDFEVTSLIKFTSGVISASSTGDAKIENGKLIYTLMSALTTSGILKIQVSAHWTTNNDEIIEKSSIGKISMYPSLKAGNMIPTDDLSVYAALNRLEQRVESLETAEEQDFGYLAVMGAARLLFVSDTVTPLADAADDDEAVDLLDEMVENFDGETMDYTMVTIPASGTNPARLAMVYKTENGLQTGVYSGKSLLEVVLSA